MSQPYKLDDQHRIVVADARQWALERLRDERDEDEDDGRPSRPDELKGEELWSVVGWYPTVEGCCRAWAQRAARASSAALPQALAKATKRLEKVLEDVKVATANL